MPCTALFCGLDADSVRHLLLIHSILVLACNILLAAHAHIIHNCRHLMTCTLVVFPVCRRWAFLSSNNECPAIAVEATLTHHHSIYFHVCRMDQVIEYYLLAKVSLGNLYDHLFPETLCKMIYPYLSLSYLLSCAYV